MSKIERKTKNDLFCKYINKQLIMCEYDKKQLAVFLSMSLATVYNKLKDPDTFTRKEIQVIFRKLEFSPDEMLAVM
jgi:DNA-binding NtrC family response regulator